MLRSEWGCGKPWPFAKPASGFDKTVITRPGYEFLKDHRDSGEGRTDALIEAEAENRRAYRAR